MSAEHAPIIPISEPRRSDEIIKRLIDRRATLAADAEFIAGELAAVDAQLIDLLGTVGTHDVDGVKVQVREYSRTDFAAVAAAYPAAQYPTLYVTRTEIDQAAVKKQFAQAVLDQFKVTGKKSVVIK